MKAKHSRDSKHLLILLDALFWNYKGEDLTYVVKSDIVGLLERGDGGQMHPIRMSWGKQLRQKKLSEDDTLTRKVAQMVEFLFKQVLGQVILLDAKDDSATKGDSGTQL